MDTISTKPQIEYISATEAAKLIRQLLKRTYPGVKFSVRKSSSGSLNIDWTDGPTQKAVDVLTAAFSGQGFDGMIDMAYSYRSWLLPDGSAQSAGTQGTTGSMGMVQPFEAPKPHPEARLVHFSTSYIFTQRDLSDAFVQRARRLFEDLSPQGKCDFLNAAGPRRNMSNDELNDPAFLAPYYARSIAA